LAPKAGCLLEPLLGLLSELELAEDGVETGGELGSDTGAVVVAVGGVELTADGVRVDVLAVRAHERNAALNYRSVLARELTVEDAPVYLQTRQARRSRRPRLGDGAPENV
jgi:hypothetical protein